MALQLLRRSSSTTPFSFPSDAVFMDRSALAGTSMRVSFATTASSALRPKPMPGKTSCAILALILAGLSR